MTALTDWTFEVTTHYGLKSIKLTNTVTGYTTYGTLWGDAGVGYAHADISPITPEVHAHIRELLGVKQ